MSGNAAKVTSTHPEAPPSDLTAQARSRIGAVIDGKYLLSELLGVGTTGAVFSAHNRWAGRSCAVKLFHYQGPNDQGVLKRFLREAQAIHRVQKNGRLHPHVVDALDVGRDRDTGGYFVVQELLRGETLATYLGRIPGGRLSLPNALRILRPVIDAVACAHEGAVVHRDLKPDNILLTRGDDGVFPKVLDFGIAQITEERVTPVAELMGTPVYMPPEAFGGASLVDARADVWALGVMLYEVLAGQNPFEHPSGSAAASMELVMHRAPASLAALGLVPPAVWNAIRRAIAKRPSQRYPVARELLSALDAASRPVRVLRVLPGMSTEQARAALHDPSQHAWIPAPEARRTTPPPIDHRTMPPPSSMSMSPPSSRARASIAPSRDPRVSFAPPANDADDTEEPFTGAPSDYWWSVQVQGPHTADDVLRVLELPELALVVELHLSGCALGDAGVRALTEGAHLRDVAALSLRRVGLTARGAVAVAGAESLSNLLKLDVEQSALGADGLRTLLAGRHMVSLRALSLVLCELDASAAEALTGSSKLQHLVRLDLSQNQLGDDGALELAQHTRLSPDLWLSLSRNRVSPTVTELVAGLFAGRVRKVVL